MHFITKAVVAAGLLLGAAQARADVIFSFNQVGPATNSSGATAQINLNGQIVVSDAAAANGFSAAFVHNDFTGTYSPPPPSLIALYVSGGNIGLQTLPALLTPTPPASVSSRGFLANLAVGGSSSTGLTGTFSYHVLQSGSEFALRFTGTTFTGTYSTDQTSSACFASGGCILGGTVTTSIPEPASLALFGMGLAGLGLVRRKRNA